MKTHDSNPNQILRPMLILRIMMLTLMLFSNLLFVRNVDAQCGYALNFDIDEFAWTPHIPGISNNFTMEFWVKPDKAIVNFFVTNSGQNFAITPNVYSEPGDTVYDPNVNYYVGGDAGAGISVGTNGIAVIEYAAWYAPALLVYPGSISSTEWTHVAVVYSNKTPSLYINGTHVMDGQQSLKANIHPSSNLGDGRENSHFEGTIDEVRIWGAALSSETISNWYDQTVTSSHPDYANLYIYWKINEGIGTILTDESGNQHVGYLSGNPPEWITDTWNTFTISVDAGPDVPSYFGLGGEELITRTAVVTGGTPPYFYYWTINRPIFCNQVNSEDEWFWGFGTGNTQYTGIACPETGEGDGTIVSCWDEGLETINARLIVPTEVFVTVTDGNGCEATDSFIINAVDVRCLAGNSGNGKVKICHVSNDPDNPWTEICVAQNSLQTHLDHGDMLGPCDFNKNSDPIVELSESSHFNLFPNPATKQVTVEFESETENSYIIEIDDMMGRKLDSYHGKSIPGDNMSEIDLAGIQRGIYLVKLVHDGKQEVRKLAVE